MTNYCHYKVFLIKKYKYFKFLKCSFLLMKVKLKYHANIPSFLGENVRK